MTHLYALGYPWETVDEHAPQVECRAIGLFRVSNADPDPPYRVDILEIKIEAVIGKAGRTVD